MFCPGCGTENTDNSPICKKCGFNFSESLAPPPGQPMYAVPPQQPKSKAPIVIISCVVIFAIIFVVGIIAAIAIPSLLNARRNANQNAAMARCKSFSMAASDFATSKDDKTYWQSETEDFGYYFRHVSKGSGYYFYYYSNSDTGDTATKYIYIASPVTWSSGRKAFIVDETSQLYERVFESAADLGGFFIETTDFDWEAENSWMEYSRLPDSGTWTKK